MSKHYEGGSPLAGPVRIAAVDISLEFPVWKYGAFDWNLSFPLADVTIAPANGGPLENDLGFVVQGAADVALLRDARSRQLNEEFHPAFTGGFISARQSGGPLHSLWVRDVLPIENERGTVDY